MRYFLVIITIFSSLIFAEYTRFTRLDSGIVVDHEYGLQWQDDVNHTDEWLDAINYCENLDLGGENDWRMPNINELSFIIDTNRTEPAMNEKFKNVLLDNIDDSDTNHIKLCSAGSYGDYYWSSTSSDENQSQAIGITFKSGRHYRDSKKKYNDGTSYEQNCSVRCVRSDFD